MLTVAVAFFVGLLAYVSILRYTELLDPIVDTGQYNQALYNTIFNRQLLYCPSEWLSPQGSFLGVHFSPLLFALLPIYAPFPSPETLLVLQAIALGAAAFPLFRYARDLLGSERTALAIAGAYLLLPATLSGTWGGFHLEAFLPWFLLSAFYEAYRRQWRGFLAWYFGSLCVVETIAPFLLIFAIVWVLQLWWARPFRWGFRHDTERQVALVSAGAAAGWILLSAWVIAQFSSYGSFFGESASFAWVVLGSKSASGVFVQAALHPGSAMAALGFQGGVKELYLLIFLGSLAFVPLWGDWRFLLPAGAWFAVSLLSDWNAFYTLGIMYLYYPLPFLMAATVDGVFRLGRLSTWLRTRLRRRRSLAPREGDLLPTVRKVAVAVLLLSAVVSCSTVGALSPVAPADIYFPQIGTGWPVATSHQSELAEVAALVPRNAYVATTDDLLTMVSSSNQAYVVPIRVPPGANTSNFNSTMSPLVARDVANAQFVLIDYSNPNDLLPATFLYQWVNMSAFGVRAAVDGIYLYERGWSSPPQLWTPLSLDASPSALIPGNAALVPGGAPGGGTALVHAEGLGNGTTFWRSGANLFSSDLAPGVYEVSASLGVHTRNPGAQLQVSMTTDYPVLGVGPTEVEGLNVSNYRGNYSVERWVTAPVGSLTLSNPSSGMFNWTGNLTAMVGWTTPGTWLSSGWIVSPYLEVDLYGIELTQVSWAVG